MRVLLTPRVLLFFLSIGVWQTSFGYVSPPDLSSPSAGVTLKTFEVYLSVRQTTGLAGYQFQYDIVNTFNSASLKQDTSSTFSIYTKSLRKGQKYYWRVRAYKPGDTSEWTASRDFTIFEKAELIGPANNATGILTALQTNMLGYKTIPTYIFEADTSPIFSSPLRVLKSQNTFQFVDTPLFKFGGSVYWRATAVNVDGDTLQWSDTRKYTFYTQPTLNTLSTTTNPQFIISWPSAGVAEVELQMDTSINFISPLLVEKTLPRFSLRDTLEDLLFGRKYYYRIRAKFDTMYSEWSLTKQVTVVSTGSISSPSSGTLLALNVLFGWTKIAGSSVQLQFSTTPNYSQILKDTISLASNYTYAPTLNLNTSYYLRIRYMHAKDTTGWLLRSFKTYTGQVNGSYPLAGNMNEEVRTRFSFRAVTWATSYVLEIDTGTATVFPTLHSPYYVKIDSFKYDGTFYTYADTSLHYNQNYVWRLQAIKGTEAAEPSASRKFKTQSTPVNYFPNNNYIGIGTNTGALVTGIKGSTYMQWELDTTPLFNSAEYKKGEDAHVPDDFSPQYVSLNFPNDLLFETKYYWRSRCINIVDTGEWSSVFNFITTTDVFMLNPADGSTNQAISTTLKWSTQGSAADYRYQYQLATDSDFSNKPIITLPINNNGEVIVSCSYATQYYWRARVMHSKDTCDWSTISGFKTINAPVIAKPNLLSPPANAINIPISEVTFGWSFVSFATDYDIEVAREVDFSQVVASANTEATGARMSNLTPSTRYYWRVRGRMGTIIGAWSNVRWFETVAPVGLNETLMNNPILMYPNPAHNEVIIDAQKPITIVIYDLQGKCVYEQYEPKTEQKINTENWHRGLYLVKMSSEGQTHTQKLAITE